eukprot:gnl/Dysnectes_brevis/1589_a1800_3515.p1 GENE.gnl/Dysnectes_brevis/1589_a1800_3515~~gnl/Dysnectes_brevis/1589_a1800_3515.p1  ORF type:complete len:206 (+),score=52.30 gnl/Dysnectes_brevis/1589_a1800_3515:93-620(+)
MGTVSGACLLGSILLGFLLFFRVCPIKPRRLPETETPLVDSKGRRIRFKRHPLSVPRNVILIIHIALSLASVAAAFYHLYIWGCLGRAGSDHPGWWKKGEWMSSFLLVIICLTGLLFWTPKRLARYNSRRKQAHLKVYIKPMTLLWVLRIPHTALTVWCLYDLITQHAVLSHDIF